MPRVITFGNLVTLYVTKWLPLEFFRGDKPQVNTARKRLFVIVVTFFKKN